MNGYPAQLIYDVIRNANAVVALTAQLLVVLSGNSQNMAPVRQMHTDFMDILAIVNHR